jgi:outer membrane protein
MHMKRIRTKELTAVLVALVTVVTIVMGATPLQAQQASDARLKELMPKPALSQAQGPFTFSAQAPTGVGPTVPLTIEDAVKFALQNNLDIAVQRMNPEIRDIAIAAAQAAYNPLLTSQISRSSTTTTPTSQLNLATASQVNVSGSTTYNAGLQQSLPWWGSSLNANFQNNRATTNSNNALLNPTYNSTWQATFTQPLLRNRKIDTTRRTILVSKVNRDISDVQLKASLTNLVSNVRNAYWDFVYANEAVESAKQSLALSDKLVEDNTTKVEVGTMARIDIVSAKAEQARNRQSLVAAENTRRTAELALKRQIVGGTDDPNWLATLNPIDRPEFKEEPVDVQAAIARALANRTDLAIVRKNLELNDLTLRTYHNNTLPQLDFQLSYGLNGVGGTQLIRSSAQLGSQILGEVPGGIGDALANLLRVKNPRWTVGVNVSYPIGLNSADTTLATAEVQLNQIQAQLKTIELQVANDITQAAINLRNTAESVQAAQISRELSQQRLEAEQSKFEVGMSTNYQVVQYQRDLTDARNSELRAILNFRKAQVEWDRLQQTALSNANIQLL